MNANFANFWVYSHGASPYHLAGSLQPGPPFMPGGVPPMMPGQPMMQPGFVGGPGQPGYGVPGQPGYGVPGQPGYGVPGQPGYGVPGQPGYGAQPMMQPGMAPGYAGQPMMQPGAPGYGAQPMMPLQPMMGGGVNVGIPGVGVGIPGIGSIGINVSATQPLPGFTFSMPQQYVRPTVQWTNYSYGANVPFQPPMGIPQNAAPLFYQASQIFRAYDKDWNGQLTHKEFRKAMRHCGYNVTEEWCDSIFSQIDANRSGRIDEREFCEFWAASHGAFGGAQPGMMGPPMGAPGMY